MASEIAKKVLLDELEEQAHPEAVEDVIFWALKEYAERRKGGTMTWGATIAGAIVLRIKEEEERKEAS